MPNIEFPDYGTYVLSGTTLFTNGSIIINNVMPIHPIFVYLLHDPIMIKLANILLSTMSIYLIYQITFIIFKETVYALTASVIALFYPYFTFYSITGLTETLYIFLLLSSFLLLYKKQFFWASVVIVLSILHRPLLDFLAPILIFTFAYYVHQLSLKKSFFHLLKYFFIYIILMTPWWIHQYNKYDQFVRLNLGDGLVWYSGNNPLNKSGGGNLSDIKGADMDLTEFLKIKDPIKRNNALKHAAFAFIKENPERFIELSGLKFIRFWRLWPYAPEYEKPMYIIISLLSYGLVLLFSIIFLFKYLKNYFRAFLPIILLVLYFTFIHMILLASIRYRLPLEPFLIMMASYSFVNLIIKNISETNK